MNNRKWIKLLAVLTIASVLIIAATQRFDRIVANSIIVTGSNGVTLSNSNAATDLAGTLNADGAVTFNSTFDVDGATTLNSSLDVDGNLTSGTGAVTVADTINVTGAADFDSTLNADGAVTFNSTLDVDGNLTSGTGAVTVADTINVTGAADFDSTLNADGAVTFNSTLDVDGNLTSGTGAVTVADTINVTGAADFDSTLNVDSDVTMATDLNVTAQTFYTVTMGIPITPTGLFMQIDIVTPTAGGGTSEIAPGSNGQLLIMENMHATSGITIDGTGGTVECKADVVLAPGDTLTLIYDTVGVVWRCLSTYDNS